MKQLNDQQILVVGGGGAPSPFVVMGGVVGGMFGSSLYASVPNLPHIISIFFGFGIGMVVGAGIFSVIETEVKSILI